jgi:hypothetical protein
MTDLTPESEALLRSWTDPNDEQLAARSPWTRDWLALRLPAIEAAAIARDREEDDRGLALRWDADMRAIKRWQAAHPERGEVWPDHADMVVWLLDEWLAMRVAIEEHVEVGCITGHTGGNLVRLLALDAPEAQCRCGHTQRVHVTDVDWDEHSGCTSTGCDCRLFAIPEAQS